MRVRKDRAITLWKQMPMEVNPARVASKGLQVQYREELGNP